MTSIYEQNLPEVFPFFLAAGPPVVRACVRDLIAEERSQTDDPARDGSSFAVTVEHGPTGWLLWLSEASANYMKALWPNIGQQIQSTNYYTDKE